MGGPQRRHPRRYPTLGWPPVARCARLSWQEHPWRRRRRVSRRRLGGGIDLVQSAGAGAGNRALGWQVLADSVPSAWAPSTNPQKPLRPLSQRHLGGRRSLDCAVFLLVDVVDFEAGGTVDVLVEVEA